MSQSFKKLTSLMLAVFVAFSMIVVGTGEASAASGSVYASAAGQAGDDRVYVGEEAWAQATKGDVFLTVTGVTSSNKSIATVKVYTTKENGKKHKLFYVLGKKPGKAKVTIKYKLNGKIKSKKTTITVVAYPKPIKSLKINGVNKKLTKNRYFRYIQKYKKAKTTAKVKIVPAEGWKITDVYGEVSYVKNKKTKYLTIKNAKSKVKNGKTIKFAKKCTYLWLGVWMENEEGKSVYYTIDLYR